MNQLEQLKQMTTVVADTGDIELIKQFSPVDATTNPSLLLKASQNPNYAHLLDQALQATAGKDIAATCDLLAVLIGREILQLIPGKVSTEVDARLSFDTRATINRAKHLINLYQEQGVDPSRILIKIASTWEGIEAARQLEREGIHCNLTLLFGFSQAQACADAGAYLISPFVGRILDWYKKQQPEADFTGAADPGVQSVQRIYQYYKTHGYDTIVMGASFRNISELHELAGCDRLTISPTLLDELKNNEDSLARRLDPQHADSPDARQTLSEGTFRWHMNEDAMATEKLSEGIRNFAKDQRSLETLLQTR